MAGVGNSFMNKLLITVKTAFSVSAISLLAACGGAGEGGGNVTLPPTTGLLQSLAIAPATSSVAACSNVQYTATGKYSDGTTIDVTHGVYWEIDPATSAVAIANALNGQVVGIKAGSAVVNAWTGGGIAASAVLNISSDFLNAIAISAPSASLSATMTQSYTATATCSNGTVDISGMNIWSSSNPTAATISVSGLAKAVTTGSTTISATAGANVASSVLNVP
jgi:hypothetical protein